MSIYNKSVWIKTISSRNLPSPFPTLKSNGGHFDVAIIGGGIFGLSTAMRLAEHGAGKRVAVIEAAEIGSGISAYTTAKLSALHNLKYTTLCKSFGPMVANKYAELNQSGIAAVEENVKKYNIDCAFKRVDNCTYTLDPGNVEKLRQEADAAMSAGLPVEFVDAGPPDLPFYALAHIRLRNQARFNSYAYCAGLARTMHRDKSVEIYERSRVTNVRHLNERNESVSSSDTASTTQPYRLETEEGWLHADKVVLATHLPITDRSGHFAFVKPVVSYCIAFGVDSEKAKDKPMLEHMYINPDDRMLSIRPAETEDGYPLIVVAGEGHEIGDPPTGSVSGQYDALETLARHKISYLGTEFARWMGEDYSPADSLPYIGYLHRGTRSAFTATGFAKWGLAASVSSGRIVADLILGRPNELASTFDARRWDLAESAGELLKAQMHVGAHFVGDRLKDLKSSNIEELRPGTGGICRMGGLLVAGYRDTNGELYAVSPNCTHLGCHVRFNSAERTWDCPCHGSRFDAKGRVIHGPAVKALERYNVPARDAQMFMESRLS